MLNSESGIVVLSSFNIHHSTFTIRVAMRTISEAEVNAALDLPTAIAVIERALVAHARGRAMEMTKTHAAWSGGQLHALGGVVPEAEIAGTKTWVHTSRGAAPQLLLFDAGSGRALAAIEAFALGQLRTGAVSAIATRWLAPPAADVLAIIGSGRQAMQQVAAVMAVRPLARVHIFSPTPEHRERFAERVHAELQVTVVAATSVAAAVAEAPIVTLATRATAPVLRAAMCARGVHINAIGAITPERAELAADVFARAACIAVDSLAAARELSGELTDWVERGGSWARVWTLGQIVAANEPRAVDADLTVFKAMGMGLCDVVLGAEVYRRIAPVEC
jgi:ornithine cyclodeaminase